MPPGNQVEHHLDRNSACFSGEPAVLVAAGDNVTGRVAENVITRSEGISGWVFIIFPGVYLRAHPPQPARGTNGSKAYSIPQCHILSSSPWGWYFSHWRALHHCRLRVSLLKFMPIIKGASSVPTGGLYRHVPAGAGTPALLTYQPAENTDMVSWQYRRLQHLLTSSNRKRASVDDSAQCRLPPVSPTDLGMHILVKPA